MIVCLLLLFQGERVREDLEDRYSLKLKPITHEGASTSRDVTKRRRRSSTSEDEPRKKLQKFEKQESHFLVVVRLEIVCLKMNATLHVEIIPLGQHRNRKRKSEL